MTGIIIVGGGGFGREVIEIARAAGLGVEGVVDDYPSPELAALLGRLVTPFLGTVDWVLSRGAGTQCVIAVGNPAVRRRIAERLDPIHPDYPLLVHPDATVGCDVRIGPGTVIAPGARLSTNIEVGRHVHIDQNATVGHDTTIGDFTRLNPQACVSGSVEVGSGALVGASATILQGLHVGAQSTLGAGCVVVRDVAAGSTVKGVPAK